MNLLEIANQIKSKESKSNKERLTFKPIRKENYILPKCNLPTKIDGHNKPLLSKVYSFILLNQRRRYADGATIMPIATTEKRLLCITGSAMNSSRLVSYMINLGLLSVEDDKYQYNAYYDKDNKSKTYCYYYDNEQEIVKYCDSNDVVAVQIRNYDNIDTIVNSSQMTTFDESRVCFDSKLHLTKPTNMSVSEFEQYLMQLLYRRYPTLKHYQKLADEINDKYYHDDYDRQISFKPTFTWAKGNKYIRKIGIRATNSLVSAKTNNVTGLEDESILMKKDVLDKYKLNLSYDVKSSVPRITYFINTGIWKQDNDFYKDIYDTYGGPAENFTPEVRSAVKSMHMRGYFDSEATIGVHTRRALGSNDKSIDAIMKKFKQAVETAEGGETLDSEVFFHESCIYMDVLKELLDRGFNVWEVYDSWYSSKKDCNNEEYVKIVEEIIKKVTESYISNRVIVITNRNKYITTHTIVNSSQTYINNLANQALLL